MIAAAVRILGWTHWVPVRGFVSPDDVVDVPTLKYEIA